MRSVRSKSARSIVVIAALLILFVGGGRWWRSTQPSPPSQPTTATTPTNLLATAPTRTATDIPALAPIVVPVSREWQSWLAAATTAAAAGVDERRAFVYQLWTLLDQLSPSDRRDLLLAFFSTQDDVHFGTAFDIGPGGVLRAWPSLRAALLDYFLQRDASAARAFALELLQQRPKEPAEWTLALRALTVGRNPASWDPAVEQTLRRFINDVAWRTDPTPAWLEGFDVVVAAGRVDFLPEISALAEDKSAHRAAQFAAFLTADRLLVQEPTAALNRLNRDPSLFAATPTVRAGLFARADVRDSRQQEALLTYLHRSDVTDTEREAFADLFPLYDLAVSNNLITTSKRRSVADLRQQDQTSLNVLARWRTDPTINTRWADAFALIEQRIQSQLAPAPPP